MSLADSRSPARCSSRSRAAGRFRPADSVIAASQLFLALADASLDAAQCLQLLAQGFLALVSLLVHALALSRRLVGLADQARVLAHLDTEQRGKPAVARLARIGERLEQPGRTAIVAQRLGQRRE